MKPLRVLFLCTGNSARSVMAEALLKQAGGDKFEVSSAGTHPKGINPYTVRVLDEAGLDTTGFRSKNVVEFVSQALDYVITVCDDAAEECPIFPGPTHRLHWSFPDPAAVSGPDDIKLAAFRATLAGMREKIATLVAELGMRSDEVP